MGYNLTIGEAVLCWDEERVCVQAEGARRDDAPAFGEPTDFTSSRWPSYSGWAASMRELGLVDLMFNERNGGSGEMEIDGQWLFPLLRDHPGAAPITKGHAAYVTQKLNEYRAAHPTSVAAFEGDNADPHLCRGIWLEYWLRWAVENCKQPVLENS